MKLIVWLGNPWNEYKKTRHNIWFIAIDFLLEILSPTNNFSYDNKYNADISKIQIEWEEYIFCKPMTFMNKSWEPVSKIINFFKIPTKDILVFHDDIDLDTARLQIKFWWSSAGHNWLKNIIEKIWTKDFRRIRLGINRPENQKDVADYVLSNFRKEELDQMLDDENKEKIIELTNKFMKE